LGPVAEGGVLGGGFQQWRQLLMRAAGNCGLPQGVPGALNNRLRTGTDKGNLTV